MLQPGFMAARHDTKMVQVSWCWQAGWRWRLANAYLIRLFRTAYRNSHMIVVISPGAGSDCPVEQFIRTLPLPQQLVLLRATHLHDALAMAHDWAEASGGSRAYLLDFEPPGHLKDTKNETHER